MSTPKPDKQRIDEAFEQNDEITLAGIARQEMALYGQANEESKLKRFLGKIGDALGRLVGKQPQVKK